MEWNDEVIAQLRGLWDEGHSTAEIGRRLGISKNAVVGKAHRLSLPPRPSPIRRGDGEPRRPSATRRVLGSTLPPLPDHATVASARKPATAALPTERPPVARPPASHTVTPLPQPVPLPPQPAPEVTTLAAVRAMPPRDARTVCCCWPIGEPGTKSFRFCDGDALAGKPYCREHAQLAYVKLRDRRDEAA